MKVIDCLKHGSSNSITLDAVLFRYKCKNCLEEEQIENQELLESLVQDKRSIIEILLKD